MHKELQSEVSYPLLSKNSAIVFGIHKQKIKDTSYVYRIFTSTSNDFFLLTFGTLFNGHVKQFVLFNRKFFQPLCKKEFVYSVFCTACSTNP